MLALRSSWKGVWKSWVLATWDEYWGNNFALKGPRRNGAKKTHHTELHHGRNDVHICLKNVPISWIF